MQKKMLLNLLAVSLCGIIIIECGEDFQEEMRNLEFNLILK